MHEAGPGAARVRSLHRGKIRAMDTPPDRLEAPTAELLLDVRTPAELVFSPDGSRVAFALHATVADVGSFVPSDLHVVVERNRAVHQCPRQTQFTLGDHG